jgi:hypothetical protein
VRRALDEGHAMPAALALAGVGCGVRGDPTHSAHRQKKRAKPALIWWPTSRIPS